MLPSFASALAAVLFAPSVLGTHLFVSHYTGKIYTLTYEPSSSGDNGTLSIDSSATGCGNMPSWLTLDRTSKTLYCFDESSNSGVVSSFDVTGAAPKMTGQAKTSGADVHGWLYGGSDGNGFLSMAEYGESSISTYKLPLTSSSKVLQKDSFTVSGPGPVPSRQDAPHPHSTITDPTGQYLIVPDLGADLIRIFSINASTGKLTTCTPAKAGAGDGPRHGTWWSPNDASVDGLMLYTVNELGNSVTGWKVSCPHSGCLSLTKTQTLSTYESGAPPSSSLPVKAAEVHVRGNFLYAANRNDQTFGSEQDSLVTYNISSTGILDFWTLSKRRTRTLGPPSHVIEVIGEPNRSASIRNTQYTGNAKSSQKAGDVPADDVQELMSLVSTLRGFPSHPSKDVYGQDVKVDFNTFEIQWSNEDEDSSADTVNEIAGEQKDDFKRIADSIEALARTFARKDAAV
ncbi:hypothetical protein B0A55_08637 [Friedmanniomyces simplex]|uniref:3-carboxy-cis,cis-mucoante lactonizing enzyme n=1 Tax=Friedmanniomyces simplex TaxID=329884 RepID=A0A4U0WV67_9PEZI|nr:hypothetical protein B0A55_08637 [Friedmanniomyces simplex]